MEQYHLRTDDVELVLSIEHERRRAGLSKSRAMEMLVRAGLEQLRWRREQELLSREHEGEIDEHGDL